MTNWKLKNATERRCLCFVDFTYFDPNIKQNISQFHDQRNWRLTHALHIFNQYIRLIYSFFFKPSVKNE